MARNFYSEIHLHIVWHVKGSLASLTPPVEKLVHHYLRGKIINTPGAFIHEIGGTETHVHLAVTIWPTILIGDFIGKLKGASAHEVNQKLGQGRKVLEWQSGYGVVTFGTKALGWVKEYIRNQREHHNRGNVQARLERFEPLAHEGIWSPDDAAQAEPREAP